MDEITQETIDECHVLWDGMDGNKVASIKKLRGDAGIGLREAKLIVEADFDPAVVKANGCVLRDSSPGYYIDRIFELAQELSVCYDALQDMGFNFTPKR